jgi:hypothetical protein
MSGGTIISANSVALVETGDGDLTMLLPQKAPEEAMSRVATFLLACFTRWNDEEYVDAEIARVADIAKAQETVQ